ncbi:MAG: hypothetical protein CM15mP74_34740 [Halieaceae bacterium]|nr:MAG: hypothetical protein CM15mP74_34740 [Halieaceae bacterium]
MFDLKISGGLVVDGTGVAGQVMDIGIVGDRIVAMGDLSDEAVREIDASGRIVTPGFVDIHTHYDGQATWDPEMAPSSWHGVTTVVMGNCGVGFAPAAPDKQEWLVGLMEGVEDIPGSALTEGMTGTGSLSRISRRIGRAGSYGRCRRTSAHRSSACLRHG